MIPSAVYNYSTSWTYGPMILFLLITTATSFYIFWGPSPRRTAISYNSFTAAVAGSVASVLVMTSYSHLKSITTTRAGILATTNYAFYLFYGVYLSFSFIPGFIGFGRMSKQKKNRTGTIIVYVCYLWSAVIVGTGLALSIITANIPNDSLYTTSIVLLLLFLYYSNWICAAASLLLQVVHFRQLQGTTTRKSLIYHSALNTLSVVCFVILENQHTYTNVESAAVLYWCILVLVDLPPSVAIIVAVVYGHHWNLASSSDGTCELHPQSIDTEHGAAPPKYTP